MGKMISWQRAGNSMAKLFSFKKKRLNVQGFGKLPFYKDYISVVSAPEALKWREWLLGTFGRKKRRVPNGQWPFIFKSSPGDGLIVGVIGPGTDGVREFPFSIFLVFEDGGGRVTGRGRNRWSAMTDIWNDLKNMLNKLTVLKDIDACRSFFRSRSVSIYPENKNGDDKAGEKAKSFFESLAEFDNGWPVFMIIADMPGRESLVYDGGSVDDFLADWERLNNNV